MRYCLAPSALLWLFLPAALACAECAAGPDAASVERLVNLDGPATLGRNAAWLAAGLRAYGGKEDLTYSTLELGFGLRQDLTLLARGSLAGRSTLARPGFSIRHGGNDLELLLRYRVPGAVRLAVQGGVVFPDTPAQNEATAVAHGLYEQPLGDRLRLVFAPRAVLVDDNPIVGLGGGAVARLRTRLSLVADLTGIVHGDNTRSTASGAKRRGQVWGVGLRLCRGGSARAVTVEMGATNGTGGTTGSGLTPGLGGSVAGYARAAARW